MDEGTPGVTDARVIHCDADADYRRVARRWALGLAIAGGAIEAAAYVLKANIAWGHGVWPLFFLVLGTWWSRGPDAIELRPDSLAFHGPWSQWTAYPLASFVAVRHWPKGSVRWEFHDTYVATSCRFVGIDELLGELARRVPAADVPATFARTTRPFFLRRS